MKDKRVNGLIAAGGAADVLRMSWRKMPRDDSKKFFSFLQETVFLRLDYVKVGGAL